jgi:hypothetical protein
MYLAKSGSPTGTVTAGVFDSSGNTLHTFGTMDAGSLTTSNVLYSFTGGGDYTITATSYVGIKFASGSVGNTVSIPYDNANSYDGTNTIKSMFTSPTWADTSGQDINFIVTDTISQEASANIYVDEGSTVSRGALTLNHQDDTKIPANVTLATSTDAVGWTDRGTFALTQATGDQVLQFDATYSARYYRLTVATWGSATNWELAEVYSHLGASGTVIFGVTETDGIVSFAMTSTPAVAGFVDADTGAVSESVTTSAYSSGVADSHALTQSKTRLYMTCMNCNGGSNGLVGHYATRGSLSSGFTTWQIETSGGGQMGIPYTFVYGDTGTDSLVTIYSDSSTTVDIISFSAGGAGTKRYTETIAASTSVAVRATLLNGLLVWEDDPNGTGETTRTHTLTVPTWTHTLLHAEGAYTWLSYPAQSIDLNTSTRSYKSNCMSYWATDAYAECWTPDTATRTAGNAVTDVPPYIYIKSVNGGTGVMSAYNDPKFYFIQATSKSFFVGSASAGGTSWTINDPTGKTAITPTPYRERLNAPLNVNYTLPSTEVFQLICDNVYTITQGRLYIGDDSDCVNWKILPTGSDSLGRQVEYVTSQELVHANPQTSYTITLSAADPSLYRLETIYTYDVDAGNFDSSGNLAQHLLYGQCYVMEITESSSGNVLQTGTICADDVTSKTVSLLGITIPDGWLGNTWSHVVERYCTDPYNATNNNVIYAFQRNVVPYNATVHVYDNFYGTPSLDQLYNFTNVSGISVLNLTGIFSNQTLYIDLYDPDYDTGEIVVSDVSAACDFPDQEIFDPDSFGLLFGIPAIMTVPILTAVIFPKSLAYFGTIVTVAVIGIAQVWGYITLPVWFWALSMPFVVMAILVGFKR